MNERLRRIIDEHTEEPWGIRISLVEVKDALLPDSMQRIMARQAEAEREKRAKIIHAEGEHRAAETLKKAADVMAAEPITLQLRYLQTLVEIADDKSSTIIPLPLDVLNHVAKLTRPVDRPWCPISTGATAAEVSVRYVPAAPRHLASREVTHP